CADLTELNLGRQFKADNAVEFFRMFADCSSLTSLNLGYFNPVKATSMGSMFEGCSSLTKIDMGNFGNTENLDRIDHMFQDCSSLKSLDLSGIYTGNVTNMYCTFYGCNSLETIYVGSQWSTANVTNSALMFHNCTSLVGGQGTTFDPNHINDAYAHIDGGPSNPGYLTEKPAGKPGDANGDGKVDVNDVTTVINYILGKNPSPFIFENADVNGDGEVNVMDVTLIINIILGIN
ncbi:MAG: BspA family leucine-rich repeat surface protein, partial [Muribaculaceae bacterium]|nr:BspA family leucine-rich repeat surface protein [Muribaculaceae bacterium]